MNILRTIAPIAVVCSLVVVPASAGEARKVSRALGAAAAEDPDALFTAWVFFKDRGSTDAKERDAIMALGSVWCRRSLERRAKVREGALLDSRDLPVRADWVDRLVELGAGVRARSRWLNAVSVEVRGRDLDALAAHPEVKRVAPVGRYHKPRFEINKAPVAPKAPAPTAQDPVYGASFSQVNQIQVPDLHNDYGLSGQGIRIALLDSQFDRGHESLRHLKVLAEWDFVDDDPITAYEEGDPTDSRSGHGTMTLSVIGGYRYGRLVGPAFGADYVLARTEDSAEEMPVEEDYWVEGLEWAESLGVDIVSSSLGYLDWYSPGDLDGNTPVTTRAADLAVANGVLVVNSAGNEGEGDGVHNTLIAPADGDSVLTVGAVRSNGLRISFSSVGPTADGRIKPDVMAQGVSDVVASPANPEAYDSANGTSFSAPLVAGLAALILEAHPDWTAWDLITALRSTATRSHAPDRFYGWGICQGLEALTFNGRATASPSPSLVRLVSTNPFQPGDRITLTGAAPAAASDLRIYDCLGRLVYAVELAEGSDGVRWDAIDQGGSPVAPGIYFVRCTSADLGTAHKVVLVR